MMEDIVFTACIAPTPIPDWQTRTIVREVLKKVVASSQEDLCGIFIGRWMGNTSRYGFSPATAMLNGIERYILPWQLAAWPRVTFYFATASGLKETLRLGQGDPLITRVDESAAIAS